MKKYFKITLFPKATQLCETIALMAARDNGRKKKKTSIETLVQCAEFMNIERGTEIAQVNDHTLHIDHERETVCIIEECELFQIDDIPESLYRIPENGFGALAE